MADPATAMAAVQTFSQTAQDMLRSIPGVTEKVAKALVFQVENIMELANMEEEQVGELVGREAGRQVWRFFNRSLFD